MLIQCDNMAVVQVINAQNCKDPLLLHLMRCLHFFTALLDIGVKAKHIPGIHNTAADAISRKYLQVAIQLVQNVTLTPTPIPSSVWELLVTQRPDWSSASWRQLLQSSLGAAWLQAPKELTDRLRGSSYIKVCTAVGKPPLPASKKILVLFVHIWPSQCATPPSGCIYQQYDIGTSAEVSVIHWRGLSSWS